MSQKVQVPPTPRFRVEEALGQVAELLGIPVYEAEGLMKAHRVDALYSLDDYERDRQTLDRLLKP